VVIYRGDERGARGKAVVKPIIGDRENNPAYCADAHVTGFALPLKLTGA